MIISPSDIRERHGIAVVLIRSAIKGIAIFSTHSALLPRIKPKYVDAFVLGFTLLTLLVALIASTCGRAYVLTALGVFCAWRAYDITCKHFLVLIVDRSEANDEGYQSAVRAFSLAGLNLVELTCSIFVVEKALLWLGWTNCLFAGDSGIAGYNPRSAFVVTVYHLTSLSSIDSQCAGQSSLAFTFAIAATVATSMLVLVVVARAISSIPFVDRSRPSQ